jgi:hypothetical protein
MTRLGPSTHRRHCSEARTLNAAQLCGSFDEDIAVGDLSHRSGSERLAFDHFDHMEHLAGLAQDIVRYLG